MILPSLTDVFGNIGKDYVFTANPQLMSLIAMSGSDEFAYNNDINRDDLDYHADALDAIISTDGAIFLDNGYLAHDLLFEILSSISLSERVMIKNESLFARIYLKEFDQSSSADEDELNEEIQLRISATENLTYYASDKMVAALRGHILFSEIVLSENQENIASLNITTADIQNMDRLFKLIFDGSYFDNPNAFSSNKEYWANTKCLLESMVTNSAELELPEQVTSSSTLKSHPGPRN